MACIDSKEVKCEQDILTAIIDASKLSPQGTDGILQERVRQFLVMNDTRKSLGFFFAGGESACSRMDAKARGPSDVPRLIGGFIANSDYESNRKPKERWGNDLSLFIFIRICSYE